MIDNRHVVKFGATEKQRLDELKAMRASAVNVLRRHGVENPDSLYLRLRDTEILNANSVRAIYTVLTIGKTVQWSLRVKTIRDVVVATEVHLASDVAVTAEDARAAARDVTAAARTMVTYEQEYRELIKLQRAHEAKLPLLEETL